MTTTTERSIGTVQCTAKYRQIATPIILLVCTASVVPMLLRVIGFWRAGDMGSAFFVDDFYYYAQIARHIRELGMSSFDGVTVTNGYHPLWMLILVGLSFLTGIPSEGFFLMVFLLGLALHAAGAWRLQHLLREMYPESPLTMLASLLYFYIGVVLAVSGMEVPLVFFLFPFLLAAWRSCALSVQVTDAARFGLLSSIFILARLDAIILVALLFASFLPVRAKSRPVIIAAAICAVPIGIYLLVNHLWFGTALPISGLAKALRVESGLSWKSLHSALLGGNLVLPFGCAVVTLLALPLASLRAMKSRRVDDVAACVVICFSPVFFIITALRSDWNLWPWYQFPLILALPFSVLTLASRVRGTHPSFTWLTVGFCLVMGVYLASRTAHSHQVYDEVSVQEAHLLRDFTRTHPGRYAMGDAAGAVGFLNSTPIVQLEGLVSDKSMLAHIARSDELRAALRDYRIDYYVTVAVPPETAASDGCWLVLEPNQAGPKAPHMRGRVCGEPLLDVVSQFGSLRRRLLVFATSAIATSTR